MDYDDYIGWISDDAAHYHRSRCARLGEDRREVTAAEALAMELKPCPLCSPPEVPLDLALNFDPSIYEHEVADTFRFSDEVEAILDKLDPPDGDETSGRAKAARFDGGDEGAFVFDDPDPDEADERMAPQAREWRLDELLDEIMADGPDTLDHEDMSLPPDIRRGEGPVSGRKPGVAGGGVIQLPRRNWRGSGGSSSKGAISFEDIHETLKAGVRAGASAIHVKPGLPPVLRVDGELRHAPGFPRFRPETVGRMADSLMGKRERERFRERGEVGFVYGLPGLGRFRVVAYEANDMTTLSIKVIGYGVASPDFLGLPGRLAEAALGRGGLILVSGGSDSGKSTTCASLVDHVNGRLARHIVTLEQHVEHVFRDKRSLVNQRSMDTFFSGRVSFSEAVRSLPSIDADVVYLSGEESFEVMESVLHLAHGGKLVIYNLEASSVAQALMKIIFTFAPYEREQATLRLSETLLMASWQCLVPRAHGKGRVPAFELAQNNAEIRAAVRENRLHELPGLIEQGGAGGMKGLDQSLRELIVAREITLEKAKPFARDPEALEDWYENTGRQEAGARRFGPDNPEDPDDFGDFQFDESYDDDFDLDEFF